MTDPAPPTFISPHSLLTMSGDAIDDLLEGIRTRRLSAVRQYEDAMRVAKETSDIRARAALTKQCEQLSKAIETAERAMNRIDERVLKVRALRLELGLE